MYDDINNWFFNKKKIVLYYEDIFCR